MAAGARQAGDVASGGAGGSRRGGAKDERKERLALAIDWLLAWTSDLARVAAGGAPRRNPDFAAALEALAPRWRRSRCFAIIARSAAAGARHPSAQPRLVAESLLLGYRELFH